MASLIIKIFSKKKVCAQNCLLCCKVLLDNQLPLNTCIKKTEDTLFGMRGHFSSSCSGSAQDLFCNLLVSFPQQSLKVKGGQRLDDSMDLSESSAVNKVTDIKRRKLRTEDST